MPITGRDNFTPQDKNKSNYNTKYTHASLTKKPLNIKSTQIKLKPRLVASYDIRVWKWSGTILVEWEGMKSKKIDEAWIRNRKKEKILKDRRRWGSDGIRGDCPGPHGAVGCVHVCELISLYECDAMLAQYICTIRLYLPVCHRPVWCLNSWMYWAHFWLPLA